MKNNKSGFTLIEIIIAIALMGILTLAIAGLYVPIYNTYANMRGLAHAEQMSNNIVNIIRNEIAYSSDVVILDAPNFPSSSGIYFFSKPSGTVQTGIIMSSGGGVYGYLTEAGITGGITEPAIVRGIINTMVTDMDFAPLFDTEYYNNFEAKLNFELTKSGIEATSAVAIKVYIDAQKRRIYSLESVLTPLN